MAAAASRGCLTGVGPTADKGEGIVRTEEARCVKQKSIFDSAIPNILSLRLHHQRAQTRSPRARSNTQGAHGRLRKSTPGQENSTPACDGVSVKKCYARGTDSQTAKVGQYTGVRVRTASLPGNEPHWTGRGHSAARRSRVQSRDTRCRIKRFHRTLLKRHATQRSSSEMTTAIQ